MDTKTTRNGGVQGQNFGQRLPYFHYFTLLDRSLILSYFRACRGLAFRSWIEGKHKFFYTASTYFRRNANTHNHLGFEKLVITIVVGDSLHIQLRVTGRSGCKHRHEDVIS